MLSITKFQKYDFYRMIVILIYLLIYFANERKIDTIIKMENIESNMPDWIC